jgi:uncharacterized protein
MRTDHRPWPIPNKPWRMRQSWHQLLFAHWPVEAESVRQFIPPPLQLDVYEGQAWIGILPFHASGIRLRGLPPIPLASAMAEVNVRTYVTLEGKPGVFFFSLDATNWLAVHGAKRLYHLPYYWADIDVRTSFNGIDFHSVRHGVEGDSYQLYCQYRPVSDPAVSEKGTLEYWLTERYCLYSTHKSSQYRCNILHQPWLLQRAEAVFHQNTMLQLPGVTLPYEPALLHYAERQDVVIWGLEKCGRT